MHLIGRYHRLRAWTPLYERLGAPLLYDTKWSALQPFGGAEWWRSPRGIWHQVQDLVRDQRGVVGLNGLSSAFPVFIGPAGDESASPETFALNTAYTAGSAGRASGHSFYCPRADTISSVYFWINAFVGTAANVNDINLEIRSDNGSIAPNTGVAALATATKDPASATGWHQFASVNLAVSAGTRYWAIVGDADGNGTDSATLSNRNANGNTSWLINQSHSTTAGWTSKTLDQRTSMLVVVFASGIAVGWPFQTTVTVPNNTKQRGLLVSGFTEQLSILGACGSQAISGTGAFNVWQGSDGPTGSPVATGSAKIFGPGGTNLAGVMLSAPYTLAKATQYRLVLSGSTNSIIVRAMKVGTVSSGSAADLLQAAQGKGAWYYTEERTSPNDWGNDDTTALTNLTLFVDDQVAAAGGGSGSLMGSRGGLVQG